MVCSARHCKLKQSFQTGITNKGVQEYIHYIWRRYWIQGHIVANVPEKKSPKSSCCTWFHGDGGIAEIFRKVLKTDPFFLWLESFLPNVGWIFLNLWVVMITVLHQIQRRNLLWIKYICYTEMQTGNAFSAGAALLINETLTWDPIDCHNSLDCKEKVDELLLSTLHSIKFYKKANQNPLPWSEHSREDEFLI